MSALAVTALLLISFAAWVTTHCVLAYGLVRHGLRGWHLVWLALPPSAWLAPYWGFQRRLFLRSTLWVLFFVAYVVCLALGTRWSN